VVAGEAKGKWRGTVAVKLAISSQLEIGREEICGLLTMQNVNRELSPLVRMTVPPQWSDRPIYEWPVGRVLFSSWILLFGVLPIDRHTFFLQSTDRQQGFEEESRSLINNRWHHCRTIECNSASCRVTDVVEFQCRLPVLAHLLLPLYRLVFQHRHQVLKSHYNGRVA